MRRLSLLLAASFCTFITWGQQQTAYSILSVPGASGYTHIDTTGISILPSGRYCTPVGQTITLTHDPFGMATSPDGATTVTLHDGVFTIIDNATLANTRVPSYDGSIRSPFSKGSFLGAAFLPDSRTVYLR